MLAILLLPTSVAVTVPTHMSGFLQVEPQQPDAWSCLFWSPADFVQEVYEPMGFVSDGYATVLTACPMGDRHCEMTLSRLDLSYTLLRRNSVDWSVPCAPQSSLGFGFTWAVAQGRFYLFSGQNTEGEWSEDLYKLSIEEAKCKWKKKPPARAYGTLTAIDFGHTQYLVLFGGQNDMTTFNDLWVFDLNKEKWREVTGQSFIPSARKGHAAALLLSDSLSFLFFIGGCDESQYFSDFHILKAQEIDGELALVWVDPQSFSVVGAMTPREGHSALLVESKIVVIGGCDYMQGKCFQDVWTLELQGTEDGYQRFAWTQVTPLNTDSAMSARERFLAVMQSPVEVLILGGNGLTATLPAASHKLVLNTDCYQSCALLHSTYSGGHCTCPDGRIDTDCGASACPQACSSRGQCLHGVCICPPQYHGEACEMTFCPNACSLRGVCDVLSGECRCFPSFVGRDCAVETGNLQAKSEFDCQTLECGPSGKCVGSACLCEEPYYGDKCQYTACRTSCGESLGHGKCVPATGRCQCADSYGGEECQFFCPQGCRAGYCLRPDFCLDGYEPLIAPLADATNCYLHGTVIGGVCECRPGFCGDFCQSQVCEDCSGHGQLLSGKCECDPGYRGAICSESVSCPGDCYGNGICHLGKCFCDPGFEGEACDAKTQCVNECSGKGECLRGKCVCSPGFEGEDCSKSVECGCGDHGICVQRKCLCESGWSGASCSVPLFGSTRCTSDCSGHGLCQYGKCYCYPAFTGEDCSIRTHCSEAQCGGNGECRDGKCVCRSGFHGDYCEVDDSKSTACPDNCGSNGTCVGGKCHCNDGFEGSDCSLAVCRCSSHGHCAGSECVCEPHYAGTDCSDFSPPACPNDCSSHGRCHLGKCYCDLGRLGTDCSLEAVCPPLCPAGTLCVFGGCRCVGADCAAGKECTEGCSDHGKCVGGVCMCEEGYYGDHCTVWEGSRCAGNGQWVEGACRCLPGWTGANCRERVVELCPGAGMCSGHGACVDGVCRCEPGFLGLSCSLPQPCPMDCSGHGLCNRGQCYCLPGWAGTDCAQSLCSHDCSSRGRCVDGACQCDDNANSVDCSIRLLETSGEVVLSSSCPKGCSGNGLCRAGACVCVAGWTGSDCSVHISLAMAAGCDNSGAECSGRGVCANGSCLCSRGFGGRWCELPDAQQCDGCEALTAHCDLGVCKCVHGWTNPPKCNQPLDSSCLSLHCGDHGLCKGGKCYCEDGYYTREPGAICETAHSLNLLLLTAAVGVVYGAVMWVCWTAVQSKTGKGRAGDERMHKETKD